MTPGFGKPREELPWLYYPENNRVLINAHNFTPPGWTPSVNGKTPVAAWVPSRDTAGNGTTTLTDLSGNGHNGTLTNMDASTDWVADTDAGGVRALDFDGVNDDVRAGTIATLNGAAVASFSSWIYRAATSATVALGAAAGASSAGNRFSLIWFSDSRLYAAAAAGSATFGSASVTGTGWRHVVVNYNGGGANNAARLQVFVNGSQVSLTFTGTIPATLGTVTPEFSLGRDASNRYGGGRIDDVRVFDQVLDSTDISDLYASGSGRGIQA